jgi:hypothetical protein
MSLDGLRAWIGEVERKLGVRTRVFLVLTAIAIGGAGAGIYLAIDTRENAVSESDVQELQQELEAQIGTTGAAGATAETARLEAELKALQAQVATLSEKGAGSANGGGEGAADGGSGAEGTPNGAGGLPPQIETTK